MTVVSCREYNEYVEELKNDPAAQVMEVAFARYLVGLVVTVRHVQSALYDRASKCGACNSALREDFRKQISGNLIAHILRRNGWHTVRLSDGHGKTTARAWLPPMEVQR